MRRTTASAGPATVAHAPGHWLFGALTTCFWFEVLWRAARDAGELSMSPALAAAVGLATQLAFTAIEASLGATVWASFGERVSWARLMAALLTVSSTEAAAVAITSGHPALPAPWPVLLAGPRAAPHVGPASAGTQVFAAFGALTLARLVLATHAHAAAARTSWRRAALVVITFYLASRCAMWWSLDLMRGHSFEIVEGG